MEKVDLYDLINAISVSIDISESTISNEEYFFLEDLSSYKNVKKHNFFNHSNRTCYIALKLAKEICPSKEFLEEVYIAATLHDIGVCGNLKRSHTDVNFTTLHTVRGYSLAKRLPFSEDISNAIKFHHENYNGTGPHRLKEEEIPIIAQIIRLSDLFEVLYDYDKPNFVQREKILKWFHSKENIIFSTEILKAFTNIQSNDFFWWDYESMGFSSEIKNSITLNKTHPLTVDELKSIALVFAEIIDNKSNFTFTHSQNLANLVGRVSDYLNYDYETKTRLEVAALLHDIGKLAVPENILNKNGSLTDMEFSVIKSHVYYTRVILSKIKGFEDLVDIAANHHEKLDGTGYPLGLKAEDLSFEARLMAICDIYDALTSKRPYKDHMSEEKTFKILSNMEKSNKICPNALMVFKKCIAPELI